MNGDSTQVILFAIALVVILGMAGAGLVLMFFTPGDDVTCHLSAKNARDQKIHATFRRACADVDFLLAIGEKVYPLTRDWVEICLVASAYHGYMVAKHGKDWFNELEVAKEFKA